MIVFKRHLDKLIVVRFFFGKNVFFVSKYFAQNNNEPFQFCYLINNQYSVIIQMFHEISMEAWFLLCFQNRTNIKQEENCGVCLCAHCLNLNSNVVALHCKIIAVCRLPGHRDNMVDECGIASRWNISIVILSEALNNSNNCKLLVRCFY